MKASFTPGTTFAGYRVDSLVGRGGMGVVYRATDLSLARPVALKLVAPELAEGESFRARFLREPRLAASLDHPNVIPIYEAGEHDGQLYLAMRFVEGSDLKSVLERDGRLAPERALGVLGQVAGALDGAHRRALVHRDVKPANVLIDENGHAYLTDFGITKQLGGESTDTGRMVGTLDYLAPEQIRGDPVDGRTDVYALACLLYECLSGAPPFRRATEAETLWAHMQEEPPALKGHAALDPVLRKALAKDPEARHATCAELIDAAAPALGIRPPRAPLAPAALRHRGRRLLAAGLLLLAAVIAVAIVALTGGEDTSAEQLGNGVAAVDSADGDVASFTESRTPPGNVAVGEGAVWVLNNEERTVSRIDPETKETTRTFEMPGVPSELAAGEGAVWIGNAGGGDFSNATVSVSRLDPASGRVTRTVRLRGDEGVFPVAGAPRIAVGAGAVWAANPDGSVSRIDPESGRLVATIEARSKAWTIAAGREGVWFLSLEEDPLAVRRIDPRTNRVSETIPIAASGLLGVAVGGGSVWAAAQNEGLLWRIEPGLRPITRSIDVGKGASLVAFGDGAAWTGNYVDGAISRIDPGTNTVTSRTSIGTPQALAAGAGSAWVSVAGGTTEGALTAAGCGEVASGGGTPDVLIASDLPLHGPVSADPRALEGAIRFALERRGFRAGDYTVGYQSCDPSTPQSGSFEFRKCAANASAFARAEQVVAVVGPWSSYCGQYQIPILNRAPGGPLVIVSPIATHPGFTRGGRLEARAGFGAEGEPAAYYPTGVRNFARVIPREDLQGVGQAMLADELGLRRVFLLDQQGEEGTRIDYTDPFSRAAGRLGVGIAGSAAFNPEAKSYDALAQRVARSGAQGVFMGGYAGAEVAARLVKALRASLGPSAVIMATEPLGPIPDLLKRAGPAAHGVYMSAADVPPAAREGSPAGRSFARDYGSLDDPVQGVLTAAQATDVVMDAIARSDGTRASVLKELRTVEVEDGLLGDFRLDRGDITPAQIAIFRVSGSAPPGARVFEWFRGSVVDRVIVVPASLAG
jgi:ABC-type branched-subunit amino acid transport system substrate-binding protein/DNA-binding beta-propeller fold protein YncE